MSSFQITWFELHSKFAWTCYVPALQRGLMATVLPCASCGAWAGDVTVASATDSGLAGLPHRPH